MRALLHIFAIRSRVVFMCMQNDLIKKDIGVKSDVFFLVLQNLLVD